MPSTGEAKPPKVVVGSGWWSTSGHNPWLIGDAITRSPVFFSLWLYLVEKYIRPAQIVIFDSRSPRKPSPKLRSRVTWIEFDANYGHANDLRTGVVSGKYAGCTRAILAGATLALCNDADIFCYVEQGTLIRGHEFLSAALAGREPTIVLGERVAGGAGLHGGVAAAMHQMSLIVVGRRSLERFISAILSAPESDGELSPEVKLERQCTPFDVLGVPYGRSRPIDFSRPAFYIKHATAEELQRFLEIEEIESDLFSFARET